MMDSIIKLAGRDPREVTDEARTHHDVVRDELGQWVVLRHSEAIAVAGDPEKFSSSVGTHLQVPNGLDGAQHTAFRGLVDRYLTTERVQEIEPQVRTIADAVVASLPKNSQIDAIADIGQPFAARVAIAWLGWDPAIENQILAWVASNHEASRSGNHDALAAVATEFDSIVRSQVEPRQVAATDDVTSELIQDTSLGRALTGDEVVSILRNWTGGDISSIALCVGVILHGLASSEALVERVRDGSDAEVDAIIDELLRLDSPFVSNRRKTTCPVTIAGTDIPAGERVYINWTSANRDEEVFSNKFDPEANARNNIVYGYGPHVCPGRELSTMELRVITQTIVRSISRIENPGSGEREQHPVGGWARLPITLIV